MAVISVRMPALPLTGGCQCGKVRYRIVGEPELFYLCHCAECQRQTSSAFGESLRMRANDVVIEGTTAPFFRVSDAGNRRQGRFCPACGVRLLHGTPGADKVTVKAGTLDDTRWLAPAGHIWTASKQRFVTIGDDELSYPRQPPDGYAAMAGRWRRMLAKS